MEKALRRKLPGGRFENVSPVRSRAMAAVRGKGNITTERRLRLALVRAGIRGWQLHPKGLSGRPDFLFPEAKLAVFADGCFWHGCRKCGHVPSKHSDFFGAPRSKGTVCAIRKRLHSFRPRVLHRQHLPGDSQRSRHRMQHEPAGRLLGQRGERKLLRYSQA